MKLGSALVTIVGAVLLSIPKASAISFVVAPPDQACGHGTTITCSPSTTVSCKGNFSPAQRSIIVTEPQENCHISLYTFSNQQGDVNARVTTGTTGVCGFAMNPPGLDWASYGVFCP